MNTIRTMRRVKQTVRVICVLSGDEFIGVGRVRHHPRFFRLYGVGAPQEGELGYQSAKAALKELINGKDVITERFGNTLEDSEVRIEGKPFLNPTMRQICESLKSNLK